MLNVRIHNFGQVAILRCSGRLVLGEDIDLVRRAVISPLGKRIVALDFGDINSIDCSGLGLLVALHNWTRANRKELKLVNPAGHVKEILQLTGLYSVLDIWSCEDLAALLSDVAKPAYRAAG